MTAFNPQPVLKSEEFLLRGLLQSDFESLYDAASDRRIWAGHPVQNRYEREIFKPYFQSLLTSKQALVIEVAGQVIGTSSYYTAPDQPGTIAIGFTFLTCAQWGGGTNFWIKRLMMDHAFSWFDAVWYHIAPSNIRSQKATEKLGAVHRYDAKLNLGGAAADWKCYSISREDWASKRLDRAAK